MNLIYSSYVHRTIGPHASFLYTNYFMTKSITFIMYCAIFFFDNIYTIVIMYCIIVIMNESLSPPI